jgi:hypothetical protein
MIENKEELRAELELLKIRIEGKIQNIVFTHKKLPFDRLSKGRRLKELVIMALTALYNDDQLKLDEYIRELREKGIKILK